VLINKFKYLVALAALSSNLAFADFVVFTLDASSSLTSDVENPALGNAIASLVTNTNTGAQAIITGGAFDFVSGARDGSTGSVQSFFAGGLWSITGKVIAAGITLDNTLLAQGVFIGSPGIANVGLNNQFNGDIDVTYLDPGLLAFLNLNSIVPNTQSMTLTRTGIYSAGTFSDSGTGTTNGSLAFEALAGVPEPSSVALFGVGLASLAYFRRVKKS
jgi:hypothetical protein